MDEIGVVTKTNLFNREGEIVSIAHNIDKKNLIFMNPNSFTSKLPNLKEKIEQLFF